MKSTVSCIFPISFSGSPLSKRGTSCAWLGYFIGKHFKFKTVLSHCDLAYSFDSLRRYSDQLGLEPRTSNEGCPGRCSSHLELKTRDFRLRPCSISKRFDGARFRTGKIPRSGHHLYTTIEFLVASERFELPTSRLWALLANHCINSQLKTQQRLYSSSGGETRTPDRLLTKQLRYQLSYSGLFN